MRFSYIFSSRDCFTLTLSWNCHVFLILKLLQFLIVGLPPILVNELQKIFLIGDCNTHSYFGLVTLSYFLLRDCQRSCLMIFIEGLSHIFLSRDCYTLCCVNITYTYGGIATHSYGGITTHLFCRLSHFLTSLCLTIVLCDYHTFLP
jgi:hypothetical protein